MPTMWPITKDVFAKVVGNKAVVQVLQLSLAVTSERCGMTTPDIKFLSRSLDSNKHSSTRELYAARIISKRDKPWLHDKPGFGWRIRIVTIKRWNTVLGRAASSFRDEEAQIILHAALWNTSPSHGRGHISILTGGQSTLAPVRISFFNRHVHQPKALSGACA